MIEIIRVLTPLARGVDTIAHNLVAKAPEEVFATALSLTAVTCLLTYLYSIIQEIMANKIRFQL